MTLHHAIWTVGTKPVALAAAQLPSEQLLEDMIVAAPQMLSDAWMLIGRQERTSHAGRIDLLAIVPDGSLILIEIKRDRTPRDVVAQALDYASWVEGLQPEEIAAIYGRFAPGRSLAADFQARYGAPLEEDQLNADHQIVIVAAALDADSERIVEYLGRRGIAINVLCFQVFAQGLQQFLSRAWLRDPTEEISAEAKPASSVPAEPWNGEFYASFGAGQSRSWDDAIKYGFISAGGGTWYSNTLRLLSPGDRVWVRVPGRGFVGVGRVIGPAEAAKTFRVKAMQGDVPVIEAAKGGNYLADLEDPDRCEYFVPVRWLQTVSLDKAVDEIGLFGNQNTVCKPTTPKWRSTVERLKTHFPGYDRDKGQIPSSGGITAGS
ncbi:endonuclease NucS [Paeniroseomonas aquatica]|uniref:Endonuclease NucS n=2 Tax=Paeniroseomonas aquatica TaxID=373043 RepID=A0ABT8AHB1_9PROT|nr:endonuclease NucS domain-containing protein [Paeniroseomonas aquatica]MDN3568754.1 endonuclease NucS [Paeniroseomonas aquatica]